MESFYPSAPKSSSPHQNVGKDQLSSQSRSLFPKQHEVSHVTKWDIALRPYLRKGIKIPRLTHYPPCSCQSKNLSAPENLLIISIGSVQEVSGSSSECHKGALCFCWIFTHSECWEWGKLRSSPHDRELQLLADHPSPDRQPVCPTTISVRGPRETSCRLRCKQMCLQVGLHALGYEGAWKAEKGQLQLWREVKPAIALLPEPSPPAQGWPGSRLLGAVAQPPEAVLPCLGFNSFNSIFQI